MRNRPFQKKLKWIFSIPSTVSHVIVTVINEIDWGQTQPATGELKNTRWIKSVSNRMSDEACSII